jgi:hypothetical protein
MCTIRTQVVGLRWAGRGAAVRSLPVRTTCAASQHILDNPLSLEICDGVLEARGGRRRSSGESCKEQEDEMRHKLLQISSRGIQIPCIGRLFEFIPGS